MCAVATEGELQVRLDCERLPKKLQVFKNFKKTYLPHSLLRTCLEVGGGHEKGFVDSHWLPEASGR